jgi:hypothetical protein
MTVVREFVKFENYGLLSFKDLKSSTEWHYGFEIVNMSLKINPI